jgi:hypothetical protein
MERDGGFMTLEGFNNKYNFNAGAVCLLLLMFAQTFLFSLSSLLLSILTDGVSPAQHCNQNQVSMQSLSVALRPGPSSC